MKASQARAFAARGAEASHWDHANPEVGLERIIPALVPSSEIELTRLDQPVTSWDMVSMLTQRNTLVEDIPFKYYRSSTYDGVNRLFSNEDWLKGKDPLYDGDLALARSIHDQVQALARRMMDAYDKPEAGLIGSMEMEDLPKITAQQWKPCGWFLASPITDAQVPELSDYAKQFVRDITKFYGDKLKTLNLPSDIYDLIMLDDDPPDTMTGAPTFASGDRSHEARIAILRAVPSPTSVTPEQWIAEVMALGQQCGFPERVFYSPVVSTRMGPLKKPVTLWSRVDGGFMAEYQAVGAYNRTRFVFPAPYYINFLLSPLYVQMSGVRKHTLGLWHDPEHQAEYIKRLQKQGTKAWSIDFSGMDTGMFKHIVLAFMKGLHNNGFCQWSSEMFLKLYPQMGITFPHYGGDANMASLVWGDATPWCSGFKLTSEMDTIYGMTVLLSCLELQKPGITKAWMAGKWVFLELGDDIMFTTDFDIDADKLANDALQLWGAKLKIIHDAMFLKWFIPVDPSIPKLSRSFARFLQQTFYNEDRYSGVEGGDRPDAVMRLALQARLLGLKNHPHFDRWWPDAYAIVCKLNYVARASAQYREALKRGDAVIDEGDEAAILAYAQRQPSYFLGLRARASYEPSAATALRMMETQGMDLNMDPVAAQIRAIYVDALKQTPSPSAVSDLMSYTRDFVS